MKIPFGYWCALVLFLTFSCAPAKPERALPSYPLTQTDGRKKPEFREVQVLNEASDRRTRIYLLGNAQVPVDTPVPTRQTVENDLKRFLDARVSVSPAAAGRLRVTIQKAEAYWVLPLDEKVVIDEFQLQDLSSPEKEFVLELKVSFAVRDSGKDPAPWVFDRKISLPNGRVEFPGEIQESYRHLLDRYRTVFYTAVEQEFLARP